jgi:hypothetical protein
MAKMTKTQARKRLIEAKKKVMSVYVGQIDMNVPNAVISNADMAAIDKVIDKCLNRLR